jgi:hypothetical protein
MVQINLRLPDAIEPIGRSFSIGINRAAMVRLLFDDGLPGPISGNPGSHALGAVNLVQ